MGKPTWMLVGIGVALVSLVAVLALMLSGGDSTDDDSAITSGPTATAEPATTEPATTEPATTEPATTVGAGAEPPSTAEAATPPTVIPSTVPPTATSTPTTVAPSTTVAAVLAPWTGTWELIEETGAPPGTPTVTPGVDYFITLTLTERAFESEYRDTFGQSCDWEGRSTAESETTLAWTHVSSSGFPCSQGDGRSGSVIWTMPDADLLVLDFSELPGGTLQTYART